MVVVTDTLAHANGLSEDLRNLLPENEVFEFPVEELLAAEIATSSPQFKLQRVEALMALQSNRPAIIVTSISGTRRYLPAAEDFKNACLHLKVGSDYDITKLRGELFDLGYIPQKKWFPHPVNFQLEVLLLISIHSIVNIQSELIFFRY